MRPSQPSREYGTETSKLKLSMSMKPPRANSANSRVSLIETPDFGHGGFYIIVRARPFACEKALLFLGVGESALIT
jgi:hypothetical protein